MINRIFFCIVCVSSLAATEPEQERKISVNFYLNNTHNAPSENKLSVVAKQTEKQPEPNKEMPEIKPEKEISTLEKLKDLAVYAVTVITIVRLKKNYRRN